MVALGLQHVLLVALLLLCSGLFCVLTRRNAIGVLLGIELILNAASLALVGAGRYAAASIDGQVFAVFLIMLAAAESAIALAVVLGIYRRQRGVDVSRLTALRG